MTQYTEKQIQDTLEIIESSIANCEKVRLKLKEGTSPFSLNTNRIKALYISKAILTNPDNVVLKEDLEKATVQIASIKRKCVTGINNAKKESATYTRFSKLIEATSVILEYLQTAIETYRPKVDHTSDLKNKV